MGGPTFSKPPKFHSNTSWAFGPSPRLETLYLNGLLCGSILDAGRHMFRAHIKNNVCVPSHNTYCVSMIIKRPCDGRI